jgi:RNA polymerase sigma-70 factor, ECF subfamily
MSDVSKSNVNPAAGDREQARAAERLLVERAQAGDTAAYEELVRAHQKRVFAIVGGILRRREDVEDVAQQVFLKVYLSLGRFDLRSSFSTWLYKIAVNECWDLLRKKKSRRLVYEADMGEEQARQMHAVPGDAAGPADAYQRAETQQRVERLLAELPEDERLMMVLKEAEGFSVDEIGEVLGMNVNTVKVRLFRARRKLVEANRRMERRSRRGAAGGGQTP